MRLPLLVRCLGVVSALPLGLGVWSYLGMTRALLLSPAGVNATLIWARGTGEMGLIVLAAAVYVLYWLRVWPRRSRARVGLLVAVMVLLAAVEGVVRIGIGVGDELWIYAAVIAGCGLAPAQSLPLVALLALLTLISPGSTAAIGASGIHVHGNVSPALRQAVTALLTLPIELFSLSTTALPVLVIGWGAAGLTALAGTNAELHAARMRLALVAVDDERARLSRDLHDVLGHNLSLMALKAELASGLLDRPEHPATVELEDLKVLARTTLADLREVVGGARLPTLAGELDGARIAAEAASIDLSVEDRRGGALSPEVEAACAWIVREGMTNVVKHSGARRCRLRIEQQDGSVSVTVADDGRGGAGTGRGTGLKGLGERISAVGGQLRVEARNGALGGFQLAARLPLEHEGSIP